MDHDRWDQTKQQQVDHILKADFIFSAITQVRDTFYLQFIYPAERWT